MKAPETNIAISGHAQHGKSTLAGRLLLELGSISKEELERRWQRAPTVIQNFEKYRKSFNKFNVLFLDKRQPTFSKLTGQPDDPGRTAFPTRGNASIGSHQITIIDQPGWSRFLGNIIYGLYQSDFIILAIDAKKGVQAGTKRIAQLSYHLQVPIICICVTKMDEVGFAEVAFRKVEEQIERDLVGPFLKSTPPVIPVHALSEISFSSKSEDLAWYKGASLLELLRTARENHAPAQLSSLRCALREVYAPPGVGTVLVGVLETGTLSLGDSLVIEPASTMRGAQVTVRVRSLQAVRGVTDPPKGGVGQLSARVIAAMAVSDLSREEAGELLKHGGVVGRPSDPPQVCDEIMAELIFFQANTVYSGSEFKVRANACDGVCRISTIEDKQSIFHDLTKDEYDIVEGEVVKARVRFNKWPICVESELRFQRLTRFVLLKDNEIVACGRCTRRLEVDENRLGPTRPALSVI